MSTVQGDDAGVRPSAHHRWRYAVAVAVVPVDAAGLAQMAAEVGVHRMLTTHRPEQQPQWT